MADPEHVALAKQGSHAIARWREKQYWRRRQLDLSGAFLSRARLSSSDLAHDNLCGIDLTDADLRLADLSGAKLQGAHLWRSNLALASFREAILTGASLGRTNMSGCFLQAANLRGADLSFANLAGANLEGASLYGADLTNTDLSWANLAGADLRNAHLTATSLELANLAKADLRGASLLKVRLHGALLTDAVVDLTLFGDCDLSRVIGLESVRHAGPSIIGLDTLARSRGQAPPQFLRQAGVVEPLISAQQQLQSFADTHPRVLLVCSLKDVELAGRVQADLRRAGIASWTLAADDERALQADPDFLERTYYYDRLALVCSTHSLENPHTYRFFDRLVRGGAVGTRAILTVAADALLYNRQDPLCDALRQRPIIDLRGWQGAQGYVQGLAALLEALANGD